MYPTAASQIIEQIIKLITGLTLAALLTRYGVIYGALGAMLGVTLSELASAVFMYVLFRKKGGKFDFIMNFRGIKKDFKRVAKYSFPVTIGSMLLPLTQFIDSLLIVNLLRRIGIGVASSTALFGIYTGPVNSLVNFPVVITIALSVAIVPAVSSRRVERDIKSILEKSNFSIKLAFLVGIPAALLFYTFAVQVIDLLYPALSAAEKLSAVHLLEIASFSIIFLSVMQIMSALLQGLDRPYVPVVNLFIAATVKTALTLILVPRMSINGAALATVIAFSIAAALNMSGLIRLIGINREAVINIAVISVAGLIMAAAAVLVKSLLGSGSRAFWAGGIIAAIVYFLVLAAFKVVGRNELGMIVKKKSYEQV